MPVIFNFVRRWPHLSRGGLAAQSGGGRACQHLAGDSPDPHCHRCDPGKSLQRIGGEDKLLLLL